MTKIALLNDIHQGARNNSQTFAKYFSKFYSEVFFPYIDEHKIDTVVILGDIFDVRKTLNVQAAQRSNAELFKPISDRGITAYYMVGNHDMYYSADLSVNTMRAMYDGRMLSGMNIIDEPTEVEIDGTKILMTPWIASGNYAKTFRMIKETKASILFGHLELAGYEMYRGNFIEHGMDSAPFEKFDVVLSGHYHHKSSQGNIHYLGTQFEITWADFDDTKGFHIFDTDTRELKFIQNPHRIFHKVYYNDTKWKSVDAMLDSLDVSLYAGCYVKMVVEKKTNPYWLDMFFDKLEKSDIVNLQIIDESLNQLYTEFQEEAGSLDDTMAILNKYILGLDLEQNKESLETLMRGLYDEANSLVEQS
jgi:DNA repair exonuclease SbcCD nuclease subunit